MKRIRILHVSPAHPPTDPRIVGKQTPALADAYEVICLLPNARPTPSGRVRFIGLPFFRWLGWRLLLVHPLILWYIIRLRPVVLHIYMPELLPVALLSYVFGVKIIYEVQENLRLKFDRKPRNKHIIFRRAFAIFDRWARRHCYHIFTEDSYLTTYTDVARPYAIVHNYPDPAFFDALAGPDSGQSVPADGPHLLYVGVVSLDRGLDSMVQVMALLKMAYPTAQLHLFGRCAVSQTDLLALPDYHDAQNNLLFYGHTAPETAYAQASRYVAGLALLKPVGDYPGSYPTKLFEYMALGLPVITSDFSLYRAVVEPAGCGYCVGPTNARQIADYITRLLHYPVEAGAVGQRGKRAVRTDYNWQTERSRLLEFYQKVVFD